MDASRQPRNWRWLRRGILIFAVAAPIFTLAYIRHDVFLALAALFISHVALLYPTLSPHSQWWGPVVRSFATNAREVWLTIDDGPSAQTAAILDLLDRFEAKATFFVIGERAESRRDELAEIVARGHQLANHTYSHPSGYFWCSPRGAMRKEIDRCDALLPTGGSRLFRAPVGIKNFLLHRVLENSSHYCVGWTVRGLDTILRDPLRVARRVCARVAPGTIVLLHEREAHRRRAEFHIRCVEAVLTELTGAGYSCVIPKAEQFRMDAPARS